MSSLDKKERIQLMLSILRQRFTRAVLQNSMYKATYYDQEISKLEEQLNDLNKET